MWSLCKSAWAAFFTRSRKNQLFCECLLYTAPLCFFMEKIFFVWALSMYWCFKMSWTNVVRHNICIAAPTSCQSFLHGSLSWYNEQKWTLFATEITNNSKTWLYNFIICVPLCVCIWSHERNWNFPNFFSQSYIFNLKNFVTELIHSSVFESFSLT